MKKPTRITLKCGHCGQEFSVIPSLAEKSKYCSKRCANTVPRKPKARVAAPAEKTCSKCRAVKAASEFRARAEAHDGLRTECRQCQYETNDAWRRAHPEQIKDLGTAYYEAKP